MPGSSRDDEAREHAPLEGYAGPERRKASGGTAIATAVAAGTAAGVAASHTNEPEWWRRMPSPWKAFIQLGLLGMFVVLFAVYFYDNRAHIHRAEQERRTRDQEEREIRRAEQAQQDRRNEALASELRAVGQKFDSMGSKLEAVLSEQRGINNEIRGSSRILERLSKELQVIGDQLMKMKMLESSFFRSDSPETAPMPRRRAARPALVREAGHV